MQTRALIFDVDGTLAETEELHRAAFNAAFRARGLGWHWTKAEYARLLKTTGGKERIRRFIVERGEDPACFDIAALHGEKTGLYVSMMEAGSVPLRPGIAELLQGARAAGLRLAIATTTSRPNVDALIAAALGQPADQVFEVLSCGDEVAAKKPAPDVYALALHRLGLPPSEALAIEDSRNGLLSARAAGLACIVTPSLYTMAEDFAGAHLVLPDARALDIGALP